MKAMVLAAGFGQRMRPLTLLRAKPVLPVLNRPLLHWTLSSLARAGVREAIVNVHHLPDTVTAAVGTGERFGLRIRYAEEREILGTGGGPRAVRDFFGDAPFLLVNGDILFDFDLHALVSCHARAGVRATLGLRRNPDPERYSPVISDRHGCIVSIAGRPGVREGVTSMFTGIHVLDPGLLARLPEGVSDSVRDLYIPWLAEGGRLQGLRLRGAWDDLGRPSLYRDAQLRRLSRRESEVDGSAEVSSAHVHRSVVGARARIAPEARVERSVLWEGTRVESGALVRDSILASGAVVRSGEEARRVIVVPAALVEGADEACGPIEVRGDMAWMEVR